MPVALWFHGNVYGFEILVQIFFLLGIYLFLRVLERPAHLAWLYIALAANAFFMSYTESLGVFFAFTIGLYAVFNLRDKMMRRTALFVIAGTAAALCLTFFQYSQIAGAGEFVNRLFSTYLKRSGLSNSLSPASFSFSSTEAWARVWSNYSKGFGWFLAVLAASGAVTLGRNIAKRTASHFGKMEFAIIWLAVLPVLLHHAMFFNFTAIHDYSVLKDTVFFSLFAGILCSRLMLDTRQPVINGILAAAFIGSLLIGVNQFWKLNNNSSDRFKKTGEFIAHTAQPDEVVFVAVPDESCAHIVFYAQRNVAEFWLEKDARDLIRKNGAKRGIIFDLDEDYNCTGYRYIE